MPLFDNFRFLNIEKKDDQKDNELRTRTFNINLTRRKFIDPRIDSMIITDYNLISETKFS